MNLRVCEIVQQIKYLPGYPDHWQEKLEENLNSNDKIEHWVYIVHGKDTDDDGKLKEPHSYDAISQSYRLFGQGKNPIPERYQKEAAPQEEELQKFCSDLNISYVGGQPCYEDVTDKIDTSLFTGITQKG